MTLHLGPLYVSCLIKKEEENISDGIFFEIFAQISVECVCIQDKAKYLKLLSVHNNTDEKEPTLQMFSHCKAIFTPFIIFSLTWYQLTKDLRQQHRRPTLATCLKLGGHFPIQFTALANYPGSQWSGEAVWKGWHTRGSRPAGLLRSISSLLYNSSSSFHPTAEFHIKSGKRRVYNFILVWRWKPFFV